MKALLLSLIASTISLSPIDTLPEIGKGPIYHEGWIDFNKNGVKDVYEDPTADIDARIEDLLSQMTMEEKTCQMVTLYGYKRVLQDDLPPMQTPWNWPASKHAWALNRVQQFFVEETRWLNLPTTASEALRRHDPNHLILGSRLHGAPKAQEAVTEACAKYCDIVSVNVYGVWEPNDSYFLTQYKTWRKTDKPCFVTEFYTRDGEGSFEGEPYMSLTGNFSSP